MELWYTEEQTGGLRFSCQVKQALATVRTPYQHLAVLDTETFGPMLVLDGMVMTTMADEFIYHEMIAHPALFTHPSPERVAVIGGGDGGAIREVLKHPQVKKAVLAEIDPEVIHYSRRFLPEIAGALDDPRVEIHIGDGFAFLQGCKGEFDVVLVDSTEPVGAAAALFSREFYETVFSALKADGLVVAQSESPFFNKEILAGVYRDLGALFPWVGTYLASIPTYPGGLWSFTLAAKGSPPLDRQRLPQAGFTTKYYTPELHRSAFVLPGFVQELLGQ